MSRPSPPHRRLSVPPVDPGAGLLSRHLGRGVTGEMLFRALRRVALALGMVSVVVLVGALAVWVLGDREYSFFEAIYFAVISVATVGYAELPNFEQHEGERAIAMVIIIAGLGAVAFFQSTLTAMLVEGVLVKAFRRRRMQKRIDAMSDHLVVAGCGSTGRYVVKELHAVKQDFVVIDREVSVLEWLNNEEYGGKLLYVVGDATEDHTLLDAGIKRARGIVTALTDDRDNLFVTLSARSLNPGLRIVSKVVDAENEPKILRAGADSVVSSSRIGGLRLASELVRPKVTQFLDQMLRLTEKNLRFDEVEIPADSVYTHKTLAQIPIRQKTNLLVVALHEPTGEFIYNPSADQPMEPGIRLIVIGEPGEVKQLRRLMSET
jgi:voltage-gated potassium channel